MSDYQYLCSKHLMMVKNSPCQSLNWWLKTSEQAREYRAAGEWGKARVFAGTAFEIAQCRLALAATAHCQSQYGARLVESLNLLTSVLKYLNHENEISLMKLRAADAINAAIAGGVVDLMHFVGEFSSVISGVLPTVMGEEVRPTDTYQ